METGKITTHDEWEILPPTKAVVRVTKPVVDEWEILPPVQAPGMFTPVEPIQKSEHTATTIEQPQKSPVKRTRTALSPDEERRFQTWYRERATKSGIDPNPDNPLHKYDYRGAFKARLEPQINPVDNLYHWDSQFKDFDHPNRFVDGVDTINQDEWEIVPPKKGKSFLTRVGEGAAWSARQVGGVAEAAARTVGGLAGFPVSVATTLGAKTLGGKNWQEAQESGEKVASVFGGGATPLLPESQTYQEVMNAPFTVLGAGIKKGAEVMAPNEPETQAMLETAAAVMMLMTPYLKGEVKARIKTLREKNIPINLEEARRVVKETPAPKEVKAEAQAKIESAPVSPILTSPETPPARPVAGQTTTPPPPIEAPTARIVPEAEKPFFGRESNADYIKKFQAPGLTISSNIAPVPKGTWMDLYQKTANRMQAIESVTAKARKRGAQILPGENPKLRARESLSSSIKADEALNYQTFRISPEGARVPTGEGLSPILADLGAKLGTKDIELGRREFNDYFQSVRYLEDLRGRARIEKDVIKAAATEEQVATAQNKLAALRKKYGGLGAFEAVAKRVYDWENRVFHTWVEAGLLKQEAYDKIVRDNPHHVPLERVLDEMNVPRPESPREARFSGMRAVIDELRGSEREAKDVLDTFVKRTQAIYSISERNNVSRFVAKLKDYVPEDIELIKTPMKPIKLLPAEQTPGGPRVIYRPTYPHGKNIIDYVENGEIKYMQLKDPNLYNAMSGLNETSFGALVKLLSHPTQWLKVGATSTPGFMIKNAVFRDPATGFIQSNIGFIPYWDTVIALANMVKKTDLFHEWRASGGAGAAFVGISPGNLKKMIQGLPAKKSVWSKMNIIAHAQKLSLLLENSNRLGIYRAAKRHGLSAVEAAFESREGTLDFFRRGSHTAEANQLIAFFNAGVQSGDKFIRAHLEHPVATVVKATAAITVPSILLYLVNRDDPTYKDLPQWQKNLFWYVPVPGTNRYFFIPKPFIFGMTYGSLPERFLEYLDTKDKTILTELAKSMADVTSPVSGDIAGAIIPTALKAIVENYANKDFFRGGQPIVSEGKEHLLPQEQSAARTSETAKAVGKTLGLSPAKIEHQVLGLTGGTGRYALQATDFVLKTLGGPASMRPKNPPDITSVPVIGEFVSRPAYTASSHAMEKFYKAQRAIGQQYATFQKYVREGRGDEAKALAAKYPALPFASDLNRIANDFSDTRRAMDLVRQSSKSNEEKKILLLKLQWEMVQSAQKYNQFIEEVQRKNGVKK